MFKPYVIWNHAWHVFKKIILKSEPHVLYCFKQNGGLSWQFIDACITAHLLLFQNIDYSICHSQLLIMTPNTSHIHLVKNHISQYWTLNYNNQFWKKVAHKSTFTTIIVVQTPFLNRRLLHEVGYSRKNSHLMSERMQYIIKSIYN